MSISGINGEELAKQVIKGLTSRNMTGYFASTKEEALNIALSLIPKKSKVTKGGSMSVKEIGLEEAMINGDYDFCNRDIATDKRAAELFAYDADFFLGSCNAITKDGILVNIDGNSNRVSAYAYGPKHVLLIVSLNKVADDVDSALKRARNVAAVRNVKRFGINPPCTETGSCMNCKNPSTICCQFLFTRYSRHKDRIHVILVDEELGY